MEFLVELLAEFLIQVVGEALFELGLHSIAEPFRKPPNPWLAAVGHAIFGSILGGVTVWLLPHHLIEDLAWRWINLILTPIAVGLCMSRLGAWRSRRGQAVFRIDRFAHGYLFALCFAIARFAWVA